MGFQYFTGEKNEALYNQERANKFTNNSIALSGNVYHLSASGPVSIGPLQQGLLYEIVSKNAFHAVSGDIGTITASISDEYYDEDFPIHHIPESNKSEYLSIVNHAGGVVEAWVSVVEPIQQKLTPSSIFGSDLHSWWKADQKVVLSGAADTGLISSWTDIISGTVAPSTTLEEPFTASINNLDAINFSGASDWHGLVVGSSEPDYKFLYNGSGSLVAMVLQKDITGNTQYVLDQAINAGNRIGISCFVDSSEIFTYRLQNGSGTPMIIATGSIDEERNFFIFVNGESYSPNARLYLSRGDSPHFQENYTGTPSSDNSDFELHICARGNNESPFLGRVGELILVDGIVNDDQIDQLGQYFAEKYNIEWDYNIKHPGEIFEGSLHSWWIGSENVTLSGATGLVSSWGSVAGDAIEAPAHTIGEEPITSSINGLPAINFSGANDNNALEIPGSQSEFQFLWNGSESLVGIAWERNQDSNGVMFDSNRSNLTRAGYSIEYLGGDRGRHRVGNGIDATGVVNYTIEVGTFVQDKNFFIVINGNDREIFSQWFLNSGTSASAQQATPVNTPFVGDSDDPLNIGGRTIGSSGADPFLGSIAEVVLVSGSTNNPITNEKIKQLARYFSHKYEIDLIG